MENSAQDASDRATPGPDSSGGGGPRRTTDGGVAEVSTDASPEAGPANGAADEVNQQEVESDGEPAGETLPLDVVFEVVKNERRRLVLQYLEEHDGPVQLGALAEHIAALENDKEVSALTSTERKRVYVGLYQCHLPKMDSAGVVNFDRNPGITLGPNAEQVVGYLDVDDDGRDWNQYYLAVAAAGGVLLTLTAAAGFAAVATAVGGATTLTLFGIAAAHTRAATA